MPEHIKKIKESCKHSSFNKCQKAETAPKTVLTTHNPARSHADIEKYKWNDDENYMEITHFVHDHKTFPFIVSD